MAFPSHLREIARYEVASTVISAAKNVEKQLNIQTLSCYWQSTARRRAIALKYGAVFE